MKEKLAFGLLAIVALISISLVSFYYVQQQKLTLKPTPPPVGQGKPVISSVPIPTKTEEEKKIIAKIETLTVVIKDKKFAPQTLTIKLHDQVAWQNKDSLSHQVKGNNWGNVPINAGENFTQAFDTLGTFPYTCVLHPEMTGTIIVE